MLFVSASAQAISISGQAGEDYTNIGVGFGTESTGLALSGNWMHNDDDGDAAGVGLGLNIPVGPLLATVGGKGIYTNPKDSDEGYAAAVGGGLQWKIGNSFRLFGEYYYSPDSLSSGIDSYEEANAGARFTIMRPLSIEAGYRYLNLAGKDGNRDNAIADGLLCWRKRQLLMLTARQSSRHIPPFPVILLSTSYSSLRYSVFIIRAGEHNAKCGNAIHRG